MLEHLLSHLKSYIPGVIWPAIPSPNAAAMLSLQYQLEKNQYMPPEWIEQQQLRQAQQLLQHAVETVPYYQEKIPACLAKDSLTPELWQQIPIMEREDLQEAGNNIISGKRPKGHGQLNKIQTSGSTGMPVTAYGTQITRFIWLALTLREHLWHERDFSGKLASIRPEGALQPGKALHGDNWGNATKMIMQTGPVAAINSRTELEQQLGWLQKESPAYLLSLPSNLRALAELCQLRGITLSKLKGIRSYGELLTSDTREYCQRVLDAKVTDVYSSQELGYIALQCPEHDHYHVQAESILLEILNEDGTPSAPGETGRIVATTLLNFGAPLIRYAIGDYAEAGDPCPCGRGLPVMKQILGRQRNMLVLPDGRKHWPSFPIKTWQQGIPIKQFQFIQKSCEHIKLRLVVEQPLTPDQEQQITKALQHQFTYPFKITFDYVDEIPRSKGGKFEDFMSEIA